MSRASRSRGVGAERRAQLDALYFHPYGLTWEDAEYILSTFPIVQRKREARYGTYRTRDLILSYYDAYGRGRWRRGSGGTRSGRRGCMRADRGAIASGVWAPG